MKKTELDVGSYDTPSGAGLRAEFVKMRQWLSGRSGNVGASGG